MNVRSAPILFGLLSLGLVGTAFGQTAAGTDIINQASATFTNAANQPVTVNSNTVTTDVLPIYRFAITPDGSDTDDAGGTTPNALEGVAGGETYFTYYLENLGNTNGPNGGQTFPVGNAITLSTQDSTGDSGLDFGTRTIVVDTNDNGEPDEDDDVVNPGESYTFAYDSYTRLFVVADIPAGAQNGDRLRINLTGNADNAADTAPDTLDENNWAEVQTSRNAELSFSKTADGNVVPNGTITYALTGSNPTDNLNPFAIDGVVSTTSGGTATPQDGILISDVLPAGLTLSAAPSVTTSATDTTLLYSTDGGSTWTTTFSSSANAVALLIGEGDNTDGRIDTDGAVFSYSLSFSATVPAGTLSGTTYTNDAELRYDSDGDGLVEDGGTPDEVLTDSVTTTVDPSGGFAVGPYAYPNGDAPTTPTYTVGTEGFTITRGGDTQTIASVPEGSEVSFRHSLGNDRNYDDTFTLTSTLSGLGADDVTFYAVNPDGSRGAEISSLTIAAGDTEEFYFVVTVPADFDTFTAPLDFTVTATSTTTTNVSDDTTDTITAVTEAQAVNISNNPGGTPNETLTDFPVLPNGTALIPLSVTNNGVYPDTFDLALSGTLPNGFTTTIYNDVDCDGVIDAGTDLPLTADETAELDPDEEGCFVVQVQIPGGAAPATYDLTATATSQTDGTVSDSITNTVTVELNEDLTFTPDGAQTTNPTVPVVYEHLITNGSNQDAVVTLSRTGGTTGWTYEYSLVDPDSPDFEETDFSPNLPTFTVDANGGTQNVYVRVTPAANATDNSVDTITLTATPTYGGTAGTAASVTDTTTIDVNVYGELALVKEVSVNGGPFVQNGSAAEPGDTLTYRITGTNVGNGEINNVRISDYIPANTSFTGPLSATFTGFPSGAAARYSVNGTDWTASAPTPADGTATANGGTFSVGVNTATPGNTINASDTFPAGGEVTITFTVTVN